MIMKATVPLDMELVGELREIMAEGFVTLVDSYQRDSAQLLVSMQNALRAGDRGQLRQLAHSLKGSASNLGVRRLSRLAAQLEKEAKAGELQEPESQVAALQTELQSVTELLQQEKER